MVQLVRTSPAFLSFYIVRQPTCKFCLQQFYRNSNNMNHQQKIDLHITLPKNTKAHVFPKSQRFTLPKTQCPQAFYNNASMLTSKTTNFGYGKKSDFTHTKIDSPASNKYSILSPIGRSRGRSFACSRQASLQFSYINPQLKNLPGPGEYETNISPRNILLDHSKTIAVDKKQTFPYNQGSYIVGKYKSTKYGTIDPNSKRFPEIKQSPGPSDYNYDDSKKQERGYIVSSYRGAGSRHFDKQVRFTHQHWKVGETPGPGKYLG